MAIHIDVLARVNERRAVAEADKLADTFDAAGSKASDKFSTSLERGLARNSPRVQAAFNRVADATARATREQESYNRVAQAGGIASAKAVQQAERLAAARRREADAHRGAASAIRAAARDAEKAVSIFGSMAESIKDVGTSAFLTSRGLIALAAPAVITFINDLIKVSVTASQSVFLLPAAATAAAAGFGTLKLATQGFGDALKDIRDADKFAEDLAKLSPNAQQAALSIRAILPELDKLQKATQDAFFANVAPTIERLKQTFLPGIQGLTTSIATSFNQGMMGVANTILLPENQGQIQTLMDNIATGFQKAAPAAAQFTQAFIDIANVGSSFLPGLGSSISEVATEFANFIREARDSGKLRQWIEDGIDAVKSLGTALWNTGAMIYDVFGKNGQKNVEDFTATAKLTIDVMSDVLSAFKAVGDFFSGNTSYARAFNDFIGDIPEALSVAGNYFIGFANNVKNAILNGPITALNSLIDLINKLAGPLNSFAKFMGWKADIGQIGQIPKVPDIPQLPSGGDWGPWTPAPGPNDGANPVADANKRYSGSPGSTDAKPPEWTNPKTGQKLVMTRDGWIPADDPRAAGAATSPYGGPYDVPAPPPTDANGKPLSDKDKRDAIMAGLDPSLWKVDPYAAVPGGTPPMMGTNGTFGVGANAQHQQDVLEAQHNVESQAHDLEEAKKERLALEQDNTATAKEIDDAKWKEVEAGWALQKAQAGLVQQMHRNSSQLKDATGELGAALDPDLGLSKGLAGFADNMTRLLGNMLFAPLEAKLQDTVNNDPIKGGFGLLGILGAQNVSKGLSPLLGRPYPDGTTPGMNPGTGSSSGWTPMAGTAAPQAIAGESPRDFAHRAMMPFFQSQGFEVGDHAADKYGEHQNGALDIMVNSLADGQKVLAEALNDPNVNGAIFNNQTYGYGHGATPKDYSAGHTGDPSQDHTNHVHILYKPGDPGNINPTGTGGIVEDGSAAGFSTAGLGSSGATPVFVVNMPGGGGFALGGGAAGASGATAGGSGATPAGPGAEGWRGVVADTVAKYGAAAGIPANAFGAWTDAIVSQIDTESKGNPNAQNPNGSDGRGGKQSVSGLLQYLPSSYANSGGALTGLPMMDPVGQIAGALAAPRNADGTPNTGARGGIGAGHGWGPVGFGAPLGNPADSFTGGGGQGPIFKKPPANPNGIASASGQGSGDLNEGKTYTPPGAEFGPTGIAGLDPTSPFGPLGITPGAPPFGPLGQTPGTIGPFATPGGMTGIGSAAGITPGGISGMPGPTMSGPAATPTTYGGLAPTVGASNGKGGIGMAPGGTLDTAVSAAAAGLDVIAPGAGQAAQMGIKLANRAIQYGGQLAGIGVGGLMETFLPTGGSELANNGWLPRIVGGLAGASPALPNIAGGATGTNAAQPPLSPDQAQQHQGNGAAPGPQINVEYNANKQTEDQNGKSLAYQLANLPTGGMAGKP